MEPQSYIFKKKKLTVEKDRTTLSVTEVEMPLSAEQQPDNEQPGFFKRYVMPTFFRLIQYLPVFIKLLSTMQEASQW
ncbi:hypothetical protein CK503_04180 [Aliifodinibius salipaludis]|uniref:Uncharacterized protein n=1 Tax=Fodinibius salipaludis TaxID=2032627 RepID=A0A2A2GCW9_9BACT|nr:hypothetical protein [Aliifodinibius salipaludis]PAU95401.1 hypothetical protein CK503_04180 [Aliifodinibius salipaludis]